MADDFTGCLKLNEYLDKCIQVAQPESILDRQAEAAQRFTDIMHGLSSPRSKGIHGGKMLASITYTQNTSTTETDVGWGLWYGRLKESGHDVGGFGRKKAKKTHVKAQPHMRPTFEAHRAELLQILAKDTREV